MGAISYVAAVANALGDAFDSGLQRCGNTVKFCAKNGGGIIGSTVLGGIAGCFTSMGSSMGAFQGFAQGTLYAVVLRPAGTYIADHSGRGKNQFNENGEAVLYLAGTVANFAIPVLITTYYGRDVMTVLGNSLPSSIAWLTLPLEGVEYSILGGLMLNIIPSSLQICISSAEYVRPKVATFNISTEKNLVWKQC